MKPSAFVSAVIFTAAALLMGAATVVLVRSADPFTSITPLALTLVCVGCAIQALVERPS